MKLNCTKIMRMHYLTDYMRMGWRGDKSNMRNNTKRAWNKHFKNKWKRYIDKVEPIE